MIKQNVNIVNCNLLYEILKEIKENLSFNIINYKNEEDFNRVKPINFEKTLIISNSKNTILNKKNVLILNQLPISLKKLVELININLIKIRFNSQSKINIKSYELNLNSKIFSKDGINLKLTEKEIEIILYLDLKKTKRNVLDLQKNFIARGLKNQNLIRGLLNQKKAKSIFKRIKTFKQV